MSDEDFDLIAWSRRVGLGTTLKRIAAFCSAHAAALLAGSTVLIYGIGLFRTVTQLNAAHVQTLRGLPLAPLQGYFVAGLAVVLNPAVLFLLLLSLALLIVFRASLDNRTEPEQPEHIVPISDRSAFADMRESVIRFFEEDRPPLRLLSEARPWVVAAIVLLIITLNLPVVVLVTGVAFAIPFLPLGFTSLVRRGPPKLRFDVMVSVLVAAFALALLTYVYLAPPPLDRVTIRATNGEHVRAELLTQTSSMVYMVGRQDGRYADATIVAFPTNRIARMEISHGVPRHFRSLADGLKIDLAPFNLPDLPKVPSPRDIADSIV